MLWASVLVGAGLIAWGLRAVYRALWRLATVVGAVGTILERVANRSAQANGLPPIADEADRDQFIDALRPR